MSSHAESKHADAQHGSGHHRNYVKIWAILLGLLIISVLGPMLGIRLVTIITAFGIALVKAYLVAKNFMHLDVEKPFAGLPESIQSIVLYGTKEKISFSYLNERGRTILKEHAFEGIIPNLERRYKETDSLTVREELAKYLNQKPCPACNGARLRTEARHVKVGPPDKLDIPDIFAMPQDEAAKLLFHDPARMTADTAKMSDDELAVMFRNRETLALLTWEPWMHNPKLKHRLHRIGAPALFVRGASDGLVSAEYLEAYARLLPDARTLTIPAAGHAPHLEAPQALASAVLGFLES